MSAKSTDRKIALVTGAAGIVGPSICESLKNSGWEVAAAGHTKESFERYKNLNGQPHPADIYLAADLTSADACHQLVKEAEDTLGPLSLLVHNATGNKRPPASLAEMTKEYCSAVFRVDAEAAIHLAQAALPSLKKTKGQIINMSSTRRYSLTSGCFVYTAAKAAVEGLTEALAFELLDDGIRVNAIRLGSVPGDAFLRPVLEKLDPVIAARLRADITRKHREEMQSSGMLCASPQEIGTIIAFLVSDAGRFINGTILDVDGGLHAKMLRIADSSSRKGGFYSHTIHDRWANEPEEALKEWLEENS